MSFALTAKQVEARHLLASPATHILLRGGSRSGKTFLIVRTMIERGLCAPGSRQAILRYRFNACKVSIALGTFPETMALCFPGLDWKMNKEDWFAVLPNGAEIWFGGLDDKERTEKILGNEYVTIFLNECSQIPWGSRNIAVTRLAQKVARKVEGKPPDPLRLKMYYDENPPARSHWTHRLFMERRDPDTKQALDDASMYATMQMNPRDNADNLPTGYIQTLEQLSPRMRRRFLEGEFSDLSQGALFAEEWIDRWRVLDGKLPDWQRVVIAVDPSGAGDENNEGNDAIGIVVVALGTDGIGYLIEDLTVKAGPATWGRIATNAYERHAADRIVGEVNYGGDMVRHVIQTARPRTPFGLVRATRGKVQRAEPFGSLVEQGKIRLVGYYPELEDELAGFTTAGYVGEGSPNRADAFVWGMAALFPGIIDGARPPPQVPARARYTLDSSGVDAGHQWMGS